MAQAPKRLEPLASPEASFGARLRSLRRHRAWSQAELGRLVYVSGALVGKIEKAERRPSPDLVQRLDDALGAEGNLKQTASGLWIGHESLVSSTGASTDGSDASMPAWCPQPALILSAARAWLTHADKRFADGGAVSIPAHWVTTIEERVRQLRRMDDTAGGAPLLSWAMHDLRWARQLLGHPELKDNQLCLARLNRAVGELAQLAGWVACDSGAHSQAEQLWLFGLESATAAGDPQLGATILSCLSYQALWTGGAPLALDLIQIARDGASGLPGPALQALLATREGRAHAALGYGRDCERALDQAQEMLASGDRFQDPDWVYWVSPAILAADAGRARLDLGMVGQAAENLTAGLAMLGDAQPRNRALHLASLAEAHLKSRDVDAAAAAVSEALEAQFVCESVRIRQRLSTLIGEFDRLPVAAARNAADSIRSALAA